MAPHIDLAVLHNLFNGDRSRVREWLQLYLEEAPKMFEDLNSALLRDDADALVRIAHELRPQAHYLGAGRMRDLLFTIGECARTEGARSCVHAVEELMALGAAVKDDVRSVLTMA